MENDNPVKEIIERRFDEMVNEILTVSHTYNEALHGVQTITSSSIPEVGGLTKTLQAAIRRRAFKQKTT